MTLKETLEESANLEKLIQMAERLFPGLVSIGTKAFICKCCEEVHYETTITIYRKKDKVK